LAGSLFYARLATNISAEKFRGAATCECPNILVALLYFGKKDLILFIIALHCKAAKELHL